MNTLHVWMKRAALAALASVLVGCSLAQRFDDATRIDYQSAPVGRKLELPPDLVAPQAEPDAGAGAGAATTYSSFERGRQQAPAGAGKAAASAPAAQVLPRLTGVRIERQGQQRWLVVEQSPDQVWPVLREFWLQSGFTFTTDAPAQGLLETDWRERRPDVDGNRMRAALSRWLGSMYASGERDQFRTRIESVGGHTEVFLTHRGMTETLTGPHRDTVLWVAQPADSEREAEWLQKLAWHVGRPPVAAAATPQAAALAKPATPPAVPVAEQPERATLQTDAGQTVLWLQEGPDRSWRQLGLALDRLGFTVEDRDRARGTFYVRYVDPDQAIGPKGVVQKVFGTGAKKDLSGTPYQIVLAAHPSQAGSRVTVLDGAGQPLAGADPVRVGAQMLQLLHEQLR